MKHNLLLLFLVFTLLSWTNSVTATECRNDSDCASASLGSICKDYLPPPSERLGYCGCSADADCSSGLSCQSGTCQSSTTTGEDTYEGTGGTWGSTTTGEGNSIRLPNPLCLAGSSNPCVPSLTCICGFPDLITRIAGYIFTLIAGLAVIMFLWAGILFVTSAGSEQKVASAKRVLWWAVIGTGIAIAGKGLVAVITAVVGAPP
ncbi:MAG: pilin [Patescibacteria group bacterium]